MGRLKCKQNVSVHKVPSRSREVLRQEIAFKLRAEGWVEVCMKEQASLVDRKWLTISWSWGTLGNGGEKGLKEWEMVRDKTFVYLFPVMSLIPWIVSWGKVDSVLNEWIK